MIAGFGAAVMLLTRVPVYRLIRGEMPAPGRSVWAFPLVGAAVGAVGAGVLALCRWAGMPPALAAAWALAALALLTGALHEDGLADVADGFGGGRGPSRKLEIMRDSRIGSYGALALVLATAVRITALAGMEAPGAALVATGAVSRAGMAVPALLLPPARADGLGAAFRPGVGAALGCGVLACAVAAMALPPGPALGCVLASGCASLVATGLARVQIGGFTGDVLGATAVIADCAALSALAVLR